MEILIRGRDQMKECPLSCSHQTFPDKYNFCHYCGTKLVIVESKTPAPKKPRSKTKTREPIFPEYL